MNSKWGDKAPEYNALNEADLRQKVYANATVLKHIAHPSAELVEVGMLTDPRAIRFHPNPTDEQKLTALQRNGEVLQYIDCPSDEMIFTALSSHGYAINFVEAPTEAMYLAAVRSSDSGNQALYFIENPSEAVQIAAVSTGNGLQYGYIENPSEAVQIAFVQTHPQHMELVNNPTLAVQVAALKANTPAGTIDIEQWFGEAERYKMFSSEALDAVVPGLSGTIVSVEAMTDDVADRQRRIREFVATPVSEALELPADLDFSGSEPAAPMPAAPFNYQSAFSTENWNTPGAPAAKDGPSI